jgi:hypothetical protein
VALTPAEQAELNYLESLENKSPLPPPLPAPSGLTPEEAEELKLLESIDSAPEESQPGIIKSLFYKPEDPVATQILADAKNKDVTPEDIQRIAEAYNLTPEEAQELDSVKSYFGGYPKDFSPTAEYAGEVMRGMAGTVGRSLLFNLPQFIYKKAQVNPNYRKALDTLSEVSQGKLSPITKGAEIVGSIGGAIKLGQMAGKVAQGSGTAAKAAKYYDPISAAAGGATAAIGMSREGEELPELAKGAAVGGALYGGAVGLVKAAQGAYRGIKDMSEGLLETANKAAETRAPKIEMAVDNLVKADEPVFTPVKRIIIENPKQLSYQEFKSKISPEEISRVTEESEKVKQLLNTSSLTKKKAIAESLEIPLGKLTPEELIPRVMYGKYTDILNKTSDFTPDRSIFEIVKESPEFASRTLDRTLRLSKVADAIGMTGKSNLPKEYNALDRMILTISDGKQVAKIFDDKLGLTGTDSIEKILDEGSIKLNLYTGNLGKPLDKVYELANKIRTTDINVEDLYNELNTGNITSEVGAEFKKFFSEIRDLAKKSDVNMGEIKNYVPQMRKSAAEYISSLRKEVTDTATKMGVETVEELTPLQYTQLMENSKDFRLLNNELSNLSKTRIKDLDTFIKEYKNISSNPAILRDNLEIVAKATKSRTGEIPDWALDKDVPTLAARWLQNTFKYAALRDTVQKLKVAADIADKSGQEYMAKYLRNLSLDILGRRTDTLASMQRTGSDKFRALIQEKAKNEPNSVKRGIYKVLDEVPSFLSTLQSQVYNNLLGLNPKSALQNLTSAYLQNMPELGAALGTKLVLEATTDVAKLMATKGGITELIESKGILPVQWTAERIDALQGGIKTGVARNLSRNAMNKLSSLMMGVFTKAELAARATTYFTSKRLASHLVKNPQEANKIVARMSSGAYRRGVREALKAGDLPKLETELNNYMQATNMFNYDRLNMSEYGRYMGPLFSMFSKWPTATVGKMAHLYFRNNKKEAVTRLAQTLFIPFLTLKMADTLTDPETKEDPVYKRLIGSRGLAGWTQASSIPIGISGRDGFISSPAIGVVEDISKTVVAEDKAKATAALINNSVSKFGPGFGLLRFFGEDLPLFLTGEKQDKVKAIPTE